MHATLPAAPRHATDTVRIGPNKLHAAILHGPSLPNEVALFDGWMQAARAGRGNGTLDGLRALPGYLRPRVEDLGWSHNIMTTASNGGRDMLAAAWGGQAGFGITSTIATAISATSLTATATPFVASAYIGQIVIAEETTNAPVWGVVVSNSTSVLTIDGWKNGDGTAGTTPGATCNYQILPGAAPYRYVALTENAGAASAASTALTGELTTGSCGRALATFAHTLGTGTFTLAKTFSVTATFPAIHRCGLFQISTASSSVLGFEVVLNADASVVSGDSLALTYTGTLA